MALSVVALIVRRNSRWVLICISGIKTQKVMKVYDGGGGGVFHNLPQTASKSLNICFRLFFFFHFDVKNKIYLFISYLHFMFIFSGFMVFICSLHCVFIYFFITDISIPASCLLTLYRMDA